MSLATRGCFTAILVSALSFSAMAQTDFQSLQKVSLDKATRSSDSYNRVYKLCSQSQLNDRQLMNVYSKAALNELPALLSPIASLDHKSLESSYASGFTSSVLQHDLVHVGFDLAVNDCELTDEEKTQFISQLYLYDSLGSVAGLSLIAASIGAVIWPLHKLNQFLAPRYPKTMKFIKWSFVASSVLGIGNAVCGKLLEEETVSEASQMSGQDIFDQVHGAAGVNMTSAQQNTNNLFDLRIAETDEALENTDPDSEEYKELTEQRKIFLDAKKANLILAR